MEDIISLTELEPYETPMPTGVIKPMSWSVEKYQVAEYLALKGKSLDKVSEATGVPISAIKKWMKHPDFQKGINDIVAKQIDTMKNIHLSLCMKMLDARISKVEELGGDYSMLSTKDTLDIMEAMRKASEKKEDAEQTQYMKTIEALLVKSANQPVVVQIEGGNKSE